ILDGRRRVGRSGAPDAHVDHFGAVVRRVPDASRHRRVVSHVRRAEEVVPDAVDDLHWHQLHVERDAGGADVVVRELTDGAAPAAGSMSRAGARSSSGKCHCPGVKFAVDLYVGSFGTNIAWMRYAGCAYSTSRRARSADATASASACGSMRTISKLAYDGRSA